MVGRSFLLAPKAPLSLTRGANFTRFPKVPPRILGESLFRFSKSFLDAFLGWEFPPRGRGKIWTLLGAAGPLKKCNVQCIPRGGFCRVHLQNGTPACAYADHPRSMRAMWPDVQTTVARRCAGGVMSRACSAIIPFALVRTMCVLVSCVYVQESRILAATPSTAMSAMLRLPDSLSNENSDDKHFVFCFVNVTKRHTGRLPRGRVYRGGCDGPILCGTHSVGKRGRAGGMMQ
jgi:hypothetical protein